MAIKSTYESLWAQDTITRDRWTINAGLRYDRQYLENLASSDAGNPEAPSAEPGGPPVIPPIDFPGNDAGGFEWSTVAPRVGIAYSLGEKRDSLVRATFSRYAEQLGQLPLASRSSPLGYSYAYFYFVDANGNLRLDAAERGSLEFSYAVGINVDNPGSLESASVNDPNLGPTLTDEVTLGYERAFGANTAGGITLTLRNIHDIPETRLLVTDETGQVRLATRDDWEVVLDEDTGQPALACDPARGGACTLPNGQVVTPFPQYDLREGIDPTGGRLYTNGDREQDYRGVTLFLSRRLADRWSLRGHFTYADWDWKIGDEFRRFDDPTDEIGTNDSDDVFAEQSGGKLEVFTGSRWSFNVNGLYQVAPERPWSFNLAASVTGREGYISPPFALVGSAVGQRSAQLTGNLDDFRNEDVMVFDARIDKDFVFGDFNLNLSLDGFNLTNEHFVLQRDRDAELATYDILEVLSPRVFRFGATVRFN